MSHIRLGDVYDIDDDLIRMLPEGDRSFHASRPFVVLNDIGNDQQHWPVVMGCPISSSAKSTTAFCVQLQSGEAGMNKTSWIRVAALQPLEKSDLAPSRWRGRLPAQRLAEVRGNLLFYLGLRIPSTPSADADAGI
ncbi:type II toxin-antitoxin system PemK/MazF family toxin [Candidatus Poriferisodalis sp.]|uniref:type II toxin-antitoxin system PemK/MazF family toxin n=1 Tax=Candidatus Poriferisodalis sp. TaxID=3101277 RepID=UPI003B529B91